MITFTRTDRSVLAEWWWTVDRYSLAAVAALVVAGVVFLLAASPAIAQRLDLDAFHFVYRQLSFLAPAIALMLAVSLLTPREVRRVAAIVYFAGLILMTLALFIGPEIKGAHRWLSLGPVSLQPSELTKPAFVVLAGWMISESQREHGRAAFITSVALLAFFTGLLVLQRDFGQTLLVSIVWGSMFFMAGSPMLWVFAAGATVLGGLVGAYTLLPHVADRVQRFLNPESGDTWQIDRAMDAFGHGGFLGVGPGEGQVKYLVPDAHTDFIFSVVGEEFGTLTCLVLAALFAFLVLRGLKRAMDMREGFPQLAAAGLFVMLGLQALINMAVNLNLMPAKGMTLPFVSYGGSSMLAVSLAMGLALALTRRRPQAWGAQG